MVAGDFIRGFRSVIDWDSWGREGQAGGGRRRHGRRLPCKMPAQGAGPRGTPDDGGCQGQRGTAGAGGGGEHRRGASCRRQAGQQAAAFPGKFYQIITQIRVVAHSHKYFSSSTIAGCIPSLPGCVAVLHSRRQHGLAALQAGGSTAPAREDGPGAT